MAKNSLNEHLIPLIIFIDICNGGITMDIDNNMTVGDIIQATCDMPASFQASSVKWYIDDCSVNEHAKTRAIYDGVTSTLKVTAIKSYNTMKLACTAINKKGINATATRRLNILYPPLVNVSIPKGNEHQEKLTMTCKAYDANPAKYIYQEWQHFYEGKYIRQLSGARREESSYELVLHNLTYEDIGNYMCYVYNGVKTNITHHNGGEGTLKIQVTPKFMAPQTVYRGPIGGNITATIPFLLFSDYSALNTVVKWTNMSDHSFLQNSTYVKQEIQPRTINIIMHGEVVTWQGHVAVLRILDFQEYHDGLYSVEVNNGFNATKLNVTISKLSQASNSKYSFLLSYLLSGIGGALFFICIIVYVVVRRKGKRLADKSNVIRNEGDTKPHKLSAQHNDVVLESDSDGYLVAVKPSACTATGHLEETNVYSVAYGNTSPLLSKTDDSLYVNGPSACTIPCTASGEIEYKQPYMNVKDYKSTSDVDSSDYMNEISNIKPPTSRSSKQQHSSKKAKVITAKVVRESKFTLVTHPSNYENEISNIKPPTTRSSEQGHPRKKTKMSGVRVIHRRKYTSDVDPLDYMNEISNIKPPTFKNYKQGHAHKNVKGAAAEVVCGLKFTSNVDSSDYMNEISDIKPPTCRVSKQGHSRKNAKVFGVKVVHGPKFSSDLDASDYMNNISNIKPPTSKNSEQGHSHKNVKGVVHGRKYTSDVNTSLYMNEIY